MRPTRAQRAPLSNVALPPDNHSPWYDTHLVNPTSPDGAMSSGEDAGRPSWTFLTNHGHVLVCIAMDPGIRGRDIAARVGITERAAQSIIADLVAEGYITRTRVGRRNHYEIHPDLPLRHPLERGHPIGKLLRALAVPRPGRATSEPTDRASTPRRRSSRPPIGPA